MQVVSVGNLQPRLFYSTSILAAALFLTSTVPLSIESSPRERPADSQSTSRAPESLSAEEFSSLIRSLSEEGGYFRSDNFTSNESAYLTVADKMKELGATGGAYVGVGPEQNFTYITRIRPKIAFIVDIRRQAMIQHLMYKAVFAIAADRIEFLSRLLCRPLNKDAPKGDAPIADILTFIAKIPPDDQLYSSNLALLRKTIQEDFKFPLNEQDQNSLEYVYRSFRLEGLDIAFHIDGTLGGYFPTLRDLILQKDQRGAYGNFLASVDDYAFVRDLQRRNLIIPVVGNFAGKKALVAVGEYLRKTGQTVTAFYLSNVEQYLFEDGLFNTFAENVKKLPTTDKSLLIRSVSARYYHPAQLPGYRSTTLLQRISVFLKDADTGKFQSYRDLIQTDYISAEK